MSVKKKSTRISQLGDEGIHHREFVSWAQRQKSVEINGVEPASFPGAGIGIVATRNIAAGEALVFVPARSLLTVDPDAKYADGECKMSVHGRLALTLMERACSMDENISLKPWLRAMPTRSDVFASMPIKWPSTLRENILARLPLVHQLRKHDEDLSAYVATMRKQYGLSGLTLSAADVEGAEHSYSHAWLLVNSRSFYWDYPKTASIRNRRAKKRPRDDCIALCPFIDYFNHTSGQPCLQVEYNNTGYTVRADRDYAAGTELNVSYGTHSNDLLLVEYGFMLKEPPNKDDHTLLDDFIQEYLQETQREALESRGLLNKYVLDHDGNICHRTQCALRAILLPASQWERFVNGEDDGEKEQHQVNEFLLGMVLSDFDRHIKKMTGRITAIRDGWRGEVGRHAVAMLQMRCLQLQEMVEAAKEKGVMHTRADSTGEDLLDT